MKAEHRKELHTNYLADQMGRLVKGMRAGPQSSGSTVAWVLVSLTVAIIVVWYVTAMNSNRSPLWVKFETDASERNLAGLEKLTRDNPSTLPARASRFEIARVDLQSGMANLYSSQRDSAVSQVKNARKLYGELVKECTGDPILAPQALIGAAKAEEALVGIPESDASLEKAIGYYQELVKNYPKSFLAKTAQDRIDNLGKTANDPARVAAEKFYQEMRKLVAEAPKK
jgi:hypothetical protein